MQHPLKFEYFMNKLDDFMLNHKNSCNDFDKIECLMIKVVALLKLNGFENEEIESEVMDYMEHALISCKEI